MKSTVFNLDVDSPTTRLTRSGDMYLYNFEIPILAAYAVEYFSVQIGALSGFPGETEKIVGSSLFLESEYEFNDLDCKLIIHYHGIRNYGLLFPSVNPASLQKRLGEFYQEAETAFENAAWLTFMLMCGALFEGILFFKVGEDKTFHELIKKAHSTSIIDAETRDIMDKVRKYRNLVHSKFHERSYVSRADAMDTRTILDKLLRDT
jgi:hypothetical protein